MTRNLASYIIKIIIRILRLIGRMNTFIMLSLIYFLIITPVGIIRRIFRESSPFNTYWIKREHKIDLERQF